VSRRTRRYVASCGRNSASSFSTFAELGVLESIFHGFGRDGHEIDFVFSCRLADPACYERDVVDEILDDAGTRVMWWSLSSFGSGSPLYPDGLAGLLAEG
jgi:hypothetical protein